MWVEITLWSSDIFLICIPVAHKVYGIPQMINSANYVYFLTCQELFGLCSAEISTPPWKPLDALVTSGLHQIGIRLMMPCANVDVCISSLLLFFRQSLWITTRDYVPLMNLIGIFFQIREFAKDQGYVAKRRMSLVSRRWQLQWSKEGRAWLYG